ncbi:hypothetical protein [Deinococcus knuensis]|uniref:Uncharacterized protein n=1 Tax=Deinococcus knuensis TaxID=1837380 RepID=A0ABQ2SCT2_9DEIO|nr:hypothetical protein [Deinococcus knuensis]GGS19593.1 hypothetical protein GCM10008961_08950 [Deinococcus knuensis]
MSRVKSFLNRLLGRSEHVDTGVEHDPADPFQGLPNPAFFVNALFDTLPQNLDDMLPRLDGLLAKTALPDVAPATLDAWTELPLGWSATLTAGPYMVVLNGKRTPLKPEQQQRIDFSNWNDEQKDRLRAHRAHVHLSCWMHLPPTQTTTLLFAVTSALQPLGMIDKFDCVVGNNVLEIFLSSMRDSEISSERWATVREINPFNVAEGAKACIILINCNVMADGQLCDWLGFMPVPLGEDDDLEWGVSLAYHAARTEGGLTAPIMMMCDFYSWDVDEQDGVEKWVRIML